MIKIIIEVGFPGGAFGLKKKKKTPPANAGDILRDSGSVPQ